MAAFLRKYGTGTGSDLWIPLVKRAVVDFAVGADWTPAAGDVKITKDGGAAANIATLPMVLAMGNGALWKFVFADAELQAKNVVVTVADSATKAVEDQAFIIETYGHASAMFPGLDLTNTTTLGIGNLDAAVTSRLAPTVAARTLDVSAAGEAGIDWANIGGPTTAQNLSGTNIKTDQVVASVTGAVGSVTGAVGSVTGAVGSIGAGGIATTSFAAGAINAAAIAADAIGASELAADAVTEIQAGLATAAALATVQADTDDILARLPATLVAGRIDASVGAMAAGVVTAAAVATNAIDADALAADAVTEIQSGMATAAGLATVQADTDDIQARLPAALVTGRMDASIGAVATGAMTATGFAAGAINATVIATDAIDADALAADAVTEIWAKAMSDLTAVPGATASALAALNWLFELARNKITQTATVATVFKDDSATALATSTVSDDATTFTRGEFA